MTAIERHRAQRRRRGFIAAGLAAFVVAVVVGSGPASDDSLLGVESLEVLWIASMGVLALLGLVLLIMLNPFSGGEWTEPPKKRRRPWALILLMLFVLIMWKPELLDGLTLPDTKDDTASNFDIAQDEDETGQDRPEPVAQATDVLMMLTILGALGGAWVLLARRAPDDPAPGDGADAGTDLAPAELDATLRQVTALLRDTHDPRLAVMQSYALLEAALAEHGFARSPTATSSEHVARVLQRVDIDPEPVMHLGDLYERARFSDQVITQLDKRDAAEALDITRQQLATRP